MNAKFSRMNAFRALNTPMLVEHALMEVKQRQVQLSNLQRDGKGGPDVTKAAIECIDLKRALREKRVLVDLVLVAKPA